MTTTKRIFSTSGETARIYNLIKEHFRLTGDGVGMYEEGWTDARIAEEVGPGRLNHLHVAHVRIPEFGKFSSPAASAGTVALEARIAILEEKVAALGILHSRLCDMISVNKLVDVRHLKAPAMNGAAGGPHDGHHG